MCLTAHKDLKGLSIPLCDLICRAHVLLASWKLLYPHLRHLLTGFLSSTCVLKFLRHSTDVLATCHHQSFTILWDIIWLLITGSIFIDLFSISRPITMDPLKSTISWNKSICRHFLNWQIKVCIRFVINRGVKKTTKDEIHEELDDNPGLVQLKRWSHIRTHNCMKLCFGQKLLSFLSTFFNS